VISASNDKNMEVNLTERKKRFLKAIKIKKDIRIEIMLEDLKKLILKKSVCFIYSFVEI